MTEANEMLAKKKARENNKYCIGYSSKKSKKGFIKRILMTA